MPVETTLGISHFAIKVRDLSAAEQFYCGVLGLALERRWPHADGTGDRALWLRAGDAAGTFLALEVASSPPVPDPDPAPAPARSTENGGHHLLALRITSGQRHRFESRLAAAGVTIIHRTEFTIYFVDPEGNRLGLSHYPEAVPTPATPPPPAAVVNPAVKPANSG